MGALAQAGRPFRGLLYGGLMLTARGPKVIEWNCRFGDPETQVVLPRMEDDLLPWLLGAAEGRLPAGAPRFAPDTAICVVLAAEGYPERPRLGDAIAGLQEDGGVDQPGISVFHAGTRRPEAAFVTAGGRVLGVCGSGRDLARRPRRGLPGHRPDRLAGHVLPPGHWPAPAPCKPERGS